MIEIKQYSNSFQQEWDSFCRNSKTPLFMFERNYMDYHKDRFIDHSFMFYKDDELIAVLPANIKDDNLYSHGGLTYGGFITSSKMKQHIMNDCFDILIDYCKKNGISKIYYKVIPHIYSNQSADEPLYSLYINNAELVKIEASTCLNLHSPLKMPKGRKAQIKRAIREGVTISEGNTLEDFNEFIELENSVLKERHNTTAVHTGAELKLLYDRFPENIHLFKSIHDGNFIAGTVVFEYGTVVHTQYMAANEEAREIGALDLAVSEVINKYKWDEMNPNKKDWLDFGISTENNGRYLNEGLISQKEGFGGRTLIYQMWSLNI